MIWQLKEILKFSESPYTKIISDGVLKLQEDGILTQLRNKWWNQKYVPEEPCVSIEFTDTLMSTNDIIVLNIINWKYEAYFRFFFIQGSEEGNSAQLGLANLGGVFIVLLGGVIVSCLLALCEYMWEARRLVRDKEVCRSSHYVSKQEVYHLFQ